MQIRSETSNDHGPVHALNTAAFKQRAEADLVDMLRASGDGVISLLAEDEGDVVGHVMFSRLLTPQRCLALAPVAVSPERQNEGIAAALIRHGLAVARQSRWRAVFVLGDPAYYARFGFSVEDAAKFETPYPKEYTMALALTPGALAAMDGTLTYPAPFSAFD
jgi:putative acetyltransferase